MMEPTFNTWQGLFILFITLGGLYLTLWLVLVILENFGKRNLTKKKIIDYLSKGIVIYKFLAIAILILGFISINYITHGLLLLFMGVVGFHYIRNYMTGVFLKMNNTLKKGAHIVMGSINGVVERLLTFGMTISTESGEHYINYQKVEESGFTIKSDKDSALRKTIFLHTTLSNDELLDILFDNPMLDLKDQPTARSGEQPHQIKLQYTLEKGSTNEDFLAFLKKNEIETSLQATTS